VKVVGAISDTHGMLRPSAIAALQGCDAIVHAGDIGRLEVLCGLSALGPLTAVRGNVDLEWAQALAQTAEFELAGRRFFVIHDLNLLAINPHETGIDVVISGHSHQPAIRRRADVLFVNPGSGGRRRFRLPIAVARIEVSDNRISARHIELTE